MNYICIREFPALNFVEGDVVEISKLDGQYCINLNSNQHLFDGDIIYQHFKKKRLEGWKYSPYSFSKMDSWTNCPKKFEFNYIISPPKIEVPSPILEKGVLFHGILEFDVVDALDKFCIPDVFKALSTEDASNIVDQALSFTQTSKSYQWIKQLNGIKVAEQDMFIDANLGITDSIETALVRGFIDLIIYDEVNKKCYIFDWKTGGKSKDALKKWPKPKDQLELYAIWASQKYDVDSIEAAFVYVEHDHMAKYSFQREDIAALKKKFLTRINNIEADTKFNRVPTQLCAWCDFKGLCLGLDSLANPRDITKDQIMTAAKNAQPMRDVSGLLAKHSKKII